MQNIRKNVACSLVFLAIAPVDFMFLVGGAELLFPKVVYYCIHVSIGTILIREAIARWNKGLVSLLLLGIAYSMILDGVENQLLFNPHSPDIANLGFADFGRWGHMNVVWALGITVVHVVFITAIPIKITETLFPNTSGQLGNKTLALLILAFLADCALIIWVPSYHPNPTALAIILALIFLLIGAAKMIPSFSLHAKTAPPGDFKLFMGGLLGLISFVLTYVFFQKLVANPLLNLGALLVLLAVYLLLLLRLPELPQRSKAALAAGIYCVPLAQGIISGHSLPAAIVILMLAVAWIFSKQEQ